MTDVDEGTCILDHACHVLQNLPAQWGPSSWHNDAMPNQQAFLLLLSCGLARCRIEGRVTPKGGATASVFLEIWDGFTAESLLAAIREAAGADESAEVVHSVLQWSLTTIGFDKLGRITDDDFQRRSPMQWRVIKPARSLVEPPEHAVAKQTPRLVTIADVAKAIFNNINTTSMTPHAQEWGPPYREHRGRRPRQYDLNVISPTLRKQRPDANLDDWKALEAAAKAP